MPVERAVLDVVAKLGRAQDVLVRVGPALKGVDAGNAVRTGGLDRGEEGEDDRGGRGEEEEGRGEHGEGGEGMRE